MATRITYTDEQKEQILKEYDQGKSVEDLSYHYKVPQVVIHKWIKEEETLAHIEAIFANNKTRNTISNNTKNWINALKSRISSRMLLGGLFGAGLLSVAVVCIACYNKAEFKVQADSTLELTPTIDSLLLSVHDIENKLQQQIEVTQNVSSAVTNISNVQNSKVVHKPVTKRRKAALPVQCKCCCRPCAKTDTIR